MKNLNDERKGIILYNQIKKESRSFFLNEQKSNIIHPLFVLKNDQLSFFNLVMKE